MNSLLLPSQLVYVEDLLNTHEIADANEGGHTIFDLRQYEQVEVIADVTAESGTDPVLDLNLQWSPEIASVHSDSKSAGADTFTVLRNATDDNIMLAWNYTTSTKPITISHIDVMLKSAGTLAAAKYIQLQIDADDSGDPATADGSLDKAGVLGLSSKIEAVSISSTAAVYRFTFATPVSIAAATKFHIVAVGDWALSSSNHILLGSITDAVTGSNTRVYDDAWAAISNERVYAEVFAHQWTDMSSEYQLANIEAVGKTSTNFSRRKMPGPYLRAFTAMGGSSTPKYFGHFLLLASGKKYVS